MRWIFVDKFVELKKSKYARAIKNVSLGEDHLHDHFPGYPVMPASLIIESMAQTGGVLAGYARDFKRMVILAKIESAVFYDTVTPGNQLVLEAEMVEDRDEGCRVRGKATVNGKVVAEASLMFVNLNSSDVDMMAGENFVFTREFLSLLGVDKLIGGFSDEEVAHS